MSSARDIKRFLTALLVNDVDFPRVWAGSSFQSSSQITIRLYNPFPASDEAYYKFILAPIAILSTLAAPQSALDQLNP